MMKSLVKMIHSWLVILWTILAMGVLGSAAIGVSLVLKNSHIPHLLGRIWARSILWVARVKVDVRGIAHIDPTQSYVFMPITRVFLIYRYCWDIYPFSFDGWQKKNCLKFHYLGRRCGVPVISALTGPIAVPRYLAWKPPHEKLKTVYRY